MKECERCGKKFIPGSLHLYKLLKNGKTKYYCSYTCWRKCGGDNVKHYIRPRKMPM